MQQNSIKLSQVDLTRIVYFWFSNSSNDVPRRDNSELFGQISPNPINARECEQGGNSLNDLRRMNILNIVCDQWPFAQNQH